MKTANQQYSYNEIPAFTGSSEHTEQVSLQITPIQVSSFCMTNEDLGLSKALTMSDILLPGVKAVVMPERVSDEKRNQLLGAA